MSLNPNLGHLYHDGNISNVYTALDVQDNLRTREINARETKYLDKYAHVLDRAKSVCRRRNEWEQTCLRKQLKNIETKTPSLAKSLRLESDRLKICRKSQLSSNLPDILGNQTAKGHRHTEQQGRIYVSSWSVYSNRITRNMSAPSGSCEYDNRERIRDKTDIYDVNTALKKAERVTKTLHKLYTQTIERKLKENQMTVLDVLGKESKEELEKALFVLRGSPAGEVIENILKDKEFVSKKRSKSHLIPSDRSDSSEITGDVFVTRINVDAKSDSYSGETKHLIQSNHAENEKRQFCTRNDCSETSFTHHVSAHALPDVFDNSKITCDTLASVSSTSNKTASPGNLNSPETTLSPIGLPQNRVSDLLSINDVFQRDEMLMMSSTLANASDIDTAPIQVRWTDLFKAPELWKQNKTNTKKVKIDKNLSLVTLTGKRRQTMLKR